MRGMEFSGRGKGESFVCGFLAVEISSAPSMKVSSFKATPV